MPHNDPLRAILDEHDLSSDDGLYCYDPGESVRSPRVERPRAPELRSPTKQDRIAILAEQGMRDADIARMLGCSPSYVRVARQRAGLFEPRGPRVLKKRKVL